MTARFQELLGTITKIGYEHHAQTIVENSRNNVPSIEKTIRDIVPDPRPALVISAGPSLYRAGILKRLMPFDGSIIAADGAYIQCLKAGIVPDWVITLDPHPTRMVRWFGDPDFEENSRNDDYFQRQDLDVDFRKNSAVENRQNIELVDACRTRLAICSTAPANVVERTQDWDRYWFAPLVDDPEKESSITARICEITGLPALNTGGTVGTAGWAFAHQVLDSKNIAVVGMDFGYPMDTPFQNTQEWNMLKVERDVVDYYPHFTGHWGEAYTSPTYWWYRLNFLDLLEANWARITNCSGGGLLMGDKVDCMEIEDWLRATG